MRNYMIRRVGHSVFIVLGLMALLFFATNVMGDPIDFLVDDDATPEQIQALRERYGFNEALHLRFLDFFGGIFKGDFGRSYRLGLSARELVLERLPNTALLGGVSFAIGSLGVPIGMLAARRPRGIMDRTVNIMSFAVISVPSFWLALMLVLIVSVELEWLPTSGFEGLGPGGWKFMVLPALTLAPTVMGRNAQITRAVMIEEMGKQYVSTARAKGLAERAVLWGHVLKNASIAIVTVMGAEVAGFMNGATITETIFGWPGMGKLLVDSIAARDLPVVTAALFTVALVVMLVNLIVDLVYSWLDPRIVYT